MELINQIKAAQAKKPGTTDHLEAIQGLFASCQIEEDSESVLVLKIKGMWYIADTAVLGSRKAEEESQSKDYDMLAQAATTQCERMLDHLYTINSQRALGIARGSAGDCDHNPTLSRKMADKFGEFATKYPDIATAQTTLAGVVRDERNEYLKEVARRILLQRFHIIVTAPTSEYD